jgi:hypothetical protein
MSVSWQLDLLVFVYGAAFFISCFTTNAFKEKHTIKLKKNVLAFAGHVKKTNFVISTQDSAKSIVLKGVDKDISVIVKLVNVHLFVDIAVLTQNVI